ncbi:hypothetical protein JYU34_008386 [Plutella xylostella]|uniref:Uncharacterized protein n=1 Tax=Plutella xylostella TaxID=51655 RepID=A0ABQ7QKY0_PLUXY|nr:hypothetical protein JYU34_008386 [Plutella xylostella]
MGSYWYIHKNTTVQINGNLKIRVPRALSAALIPFTSDKERSGPPHVMPPLQHCRADNGDKE